MPTPDLHHKALWVRTGSRAAALFGVRFYNMLYGERSLLGALQRVEPPRTLQVREATARDLERMDSELDPAQAEACRIAAAQQSRCVIALDGKQIAGYSWVNTHDIHLLSWRMQALPSEGSYTYNSFVRPEHRGQKIFQCLTEGVYSRLAQEGFRFCCNLVDRDNAPSIAARRRLGAVFHPAPILKLPGLDPFPLQAVPFGATTEDSQVVPKHRYHSR
jgi:ribosomal protein S18 acetylase RimI-like enzyme